MTNSKIRIRDARKKLVSFHKFSTVKTLLHHIVTRYIISFDLDFIWLIYICSFDIISIRDHIEGDLYRCSLLHARTDLLATLLREATKPKNSRYVLRGHINGIQRPWDKSCLLFQSELKSRIKTRSQANWIDSAVVREDLSCQAVNPYSTVKPQFTGVVGGMEITLVNRGSR